MRRRIRLAVVGVALIASGLAAVPASAGVVSGKPVPTATGDVSPKPDPPKQSDDQLRKQKQRELGRRPKHAGGVSDAQLADLARRLGVSTPRLIRALSHAKRTTKDPERLSRSTVATFARELGISRAQARKVLTFVFVSPEKPDKYAKA
ncbi:hypothetical protein [Cryptosporangium phraense]|uniref:Helix-turn-helix domain-containing protein n=1 Tax=Cryptosporangium phraense TaxID=2593070 RepID=A0A545AQ48_9ACTN|nr:hypothetical protein [Cryptosporangium phraense]TQS43457.1 hypothetical protein FL583_19715 [Cryptosporangium phraense]